MVLTGGTTFFDPWPFGEFLLQLQLNHWATILGDTSISILNPGIRIFPESRTEPGETAGSKKRTMVEKNGKGINP